MLPSLRNGLHGLDVIVIFIGCHSNLYFQQMQLTQTSVNVSYYF